jgi:adenylate cyclase
MCADVVGYSRLMGMDEEGTLARLNTVRRELVDARIEAHHGRIVRTMGDGLLVEFGSVVDAVQSAIEIQEGMPRLVEAMPADRQIVWRIGINLGDLISDGDIVYGDGVTVASRLESMAEPGGINVSRAVRDQVRDRLPITFGDLGEHEIAGIARAVRVFRILLDRAAQRARGGPVRQGNKPSLAVLPFQSLGGGDEAEFFLDSVAEDLITELARARWFSVMARNTSFTYKGRAADTKLIARELAVRYVIEGSLRKAGNRVRISCQLVDGESGEHLWADRFDGTLEDSFDLQDKITESVIGSVEPLLRLAEIKRAQQKPEAERTVYELTRCALPLAFAETADENEEALRLLAKALAEDDDYPTANALAAWCHQQRDLMDWPQATGHDRQEAQRLARLAIAHGADVPLALAIAGLVCAVLTRDHDAALAAVDRASLLNPTAAIVLGFDALTRCFCGAHDEAIERAERALRLSPFEPLGYHAALASALAHLLAGRVEEALSYAHRAIEGNRNFALSYCVLALCCARLGRAEEAEQAARQLAQAAPGFHLRSLRRMRFADAASLLPDLELLRAVHIPD